MKKSKMIRIMLIVLIVLQVVLCCACSLFPDEDELEAPVLKTPKPVSYNYFEVVNEPLIKGSSGYGSVTSIYYYRHSFPTSGGTIKALYVSLGQYVNKGDLLMETDNSSLELEYLQSQIDYTAAQELFSQQQADFDKGLISKNQFRIDQLQYQIVEKKFNNLSSSYQNTQLKAEVSGKIVYINTEYTTNTSKQVVAGETMIAIDNESEEYTYLVFDKSQEAIADSNAIPQQFRIGTKLKLSLIPSDSDPNPIEFEGVIVGTDSIIKSTGISYVDTAKYYCKITSYPNYGNDPNRQVVSGTVVRYTYVEDSRESCLQIPVSACYSYNGKHYVYMLDKKTNLKKEVYIDLGIANDSRVEVLSGLKKGDRIIVG